MNLENDKDTLRWMKTIHEVAVAKGWWQNAEERQPGTIIFLMISELVEAFEEYRKPELDIKTIYYGQGDKPEGVPIELADAAIRILDYVCWLSLQCGGDMVITDAIEDMGDMPTDNISQDFGSALMDSIQLFDSAFAELLYTTRTREKIRYRQGITELLMALRLLNAICKFFAIDIDRAMQIKHDFNKTRPYRHGNKRA